LATDQPAETEHLGPAGDYRFPEKAQAQGYGPGGGRGGLAAHQRKANELIGEANAAGVGLLTAAVRFPSARSPSNVGGKPSR
jgi:hypothetical protein